MRTIKRIHTAIYSPIADLETYCPLPAPDLKQIDPFLLLNHHGPQVYPPGNHGLPFGPHPHRGIETVTFIYTGDIMHKDSLSHKESVIRAGGVQWMTAGRGMTHVEQCSSEFRKRGGNFEVIQLWLNLPSRLKMIEPRYKGAQKEEIPVLRLDDRKAVVRLVSGETGNKKGAFESLTGVTLASVELKRGGRIALEAPVDQNVLFYIVQGELIVEDADVKALQLVEFENDSTDIEVKAIEDSLVLFGRATPINEPVVARGPFVMNTEEEIRQAYLDYQEGKFGK